MPLSTTVARAVLPAMAIVAIVAATGVADTSAQLERTVVDAVNDARRTNRLALLAPDTGLAAIARRHSCAMAKAGVLSHTASDGKTMRDRLTAAGRTFRIAAENIAYIEGGNAGSRAVTGWMKSPAHRDNILGRDFTTTGVGICRNGAATYLTQLFLRPR
jgi:uncharacterized protein YkwD